jgi:hypothetical protein
MPSKARLAVALDYPNADQALKLVNTLGRVPHSCSFIA